MDISTLFDMAANRADAWNTLWQIFITVSTGGLAIVTASSNPLSKMSSGIICIGFLLFVIGNNSAFNDYYQVRMQLHEMIAAIPEEALTDKATDKVSLLALSKKIGPPQDYIFSFREFFVYYWSISFIVLVALWFIPYVRRKNQS
jgi:hypothetical protein